MADEKEKPKRRLVMAEDLPGRKKGEEVDPGDPEADVLAFTGKARWELSGPEPGAGSLPF